VDGAWLLHDTDSDASAVAAPDSARVYVRGFPIAGDTPVRMGCDVAVELVPSERSQGATKGGRAPIVEYRAISQRH
jgi:hypothetical protein